MRPTTILLFFLCTLICTPIVSAATLTGTVYDEQLSVLKNAIITIDTQPQQRLVSTDGHYRFEVPKGNYTIRVRAPLRGNMTSTETVSIDEPGVFQFDLFFFPETEEDEQFLEELDSEVVPIELTPQPRTENILGRLLLVLLLLAAGGATYYFLKRRSQLVVDNFFEAPNELDRVLTLIKKAGGRITQKDLRKQLPESEAKVSLMIAQLEAQGKIQKIKRGRGNILILK